jgi:DNA recombination-dependent growth factor C
VGKKEYAQLRQQVEFDLLPKAFIRRTVVPVLFYKHEMGTQIMLVCTSSHKRADDVVALLLGVFGIDLMPWKIETESSISGVLTTLASNGNADPDEECWLHFSPLDSAVIKGDDKQTIRIKDKPVESQDVQDLLAGEGQVVHELALAWCEDNPGAEEPDLTFVATSNLAFKRAETIVKATSATEDYYGFAVVCLRTYRDMLTHFFDLCGGIKERPASGESTNGAEDDEL